MSQSKAIHSQDFHALMRILNECRDMGDDNGRWQRHFLESLARLVAAEVAVGGELRGFAAGRPAPVAPGDTTAEWGFENGFDRRGWVRALELLQSNPTYGESMTTYITQGGTGTAVRLSDLVPAEERVGSLEFDEVHRVVGVDQGVVCFHAISNPVRDEVYGTYLFRGAGERNFSERETQIVQLAFAGVAPLIGGPLARIAEPSPADLAPRVRAVLRCMFEGDGDKAIASRLGISVHTVNQYTKAIYQHFGVNGRAELLARWIRRGWGARYAWAE